MATGCQVDGRADGRHRVGRGSGAGTGLFGPAQQRIAAQGHTRHQQRRTLLRPQPLQDPADLLEVTRVVGARRPVDLAAAAAEVRHRETPALGPGPAGECLGVMAGRGALQAVEHHQQRTGKAWRRAVLQKVHIHEIPVGRIPAFAPVTRCRARPPPPVERGPDGLQVPARQPRRGAVAVHQCSTGGALPLSCDSCAVPGLAWCTTRRQPWGVLWYTLVATT